MVVIYVVCIVGPKEQPTLKVVQGGRRAEVSDEVVDMSIKGAKDLPGRRDFLSLVNGKARGGEIE